MKLPLAVTLYLNLLTFPNDAQIYLHILRINEVKEQDIPLMRHVSWNACECMSYYSGICVTQIVSQLYSTVQHWFGRNKARSAFRMT